MEKNLNQPRAFDDIVKKVSLAQALELFKTNQPYFVMFSTKWCPDCKVMRINLKNVVNEYYQKGINFLEIDAEQTNLFRTENAGWKILRVPSFYVVVSQKPTFIGYEFIDKNIIAQHLQEALSMRKE